MQSCCKIIAVLLIILHFPWQNYSQSVSPSGYKDIVAFEDEFVAVGSGGRFDRLNKKGQLLDENIVGAEDLNAALVYGEEILTAGNKGKLLRINSSGEATEIETGTNQNLLSLALFKDKILAGGENATLLISLANVFAAGLRKHCFCLCQLSKMFRCNNGRKNFKQLRWTLVGSIRLQSGILRIFSKLHLYFYSGYRKQSGDFGASRRPKPGTSAFAGRKSVDGASVSIQKRKGNLEKLHNAATRHRLRY